MIIESNVEYESLIGCWDFPASRTLDALKLQDIYIIQDYVKTKIRERLLAYFNFQFFRNNYWNRFNMHIDDPTKEFNVQLDKNYIQLVNKIPIDIFDPNSINDNISQLRCDTRWTSPESIPLNKLLECHNFINQWTTIRNSRHIMEYELSRYGRKYRANYYFTKATISENDAALKKKQRKLSILKTKLDGIRSEIPLNMMNEGELPLLIGFNDVDRFFYKYTIGYQVADVSEIMKNDTPRVGFLIYGQTPRVHFFGNVLYTGVSKLEQECSESCEEQTDNASQFDANVYYPI